MPFGMLRSSSFAATYKNDANDAGGCCCPSGSEHCSETETLEIIREFRRLYEDQLRKIDKDGGGDCLELKVKLQQRWIEDLTAQTEMMAKVVKELELEATERVQMLEDKLEHSAKCACEVMKRYQMYDFTINSDEHFQKLYYLENDVKNLVEFVRRVREDGRWTIDGLQFYDITYEDLFGKDKKSSDESIPNDESRGAPGEDVIILPKDVQDKLLIELKKEVQQLRTQGNSSELLDELKRKSSEFENLRRSMLDMRSALTEEVACKHDMISLLKKDIQQLEERCLQADKQTAFKDDIIKEMRKEIKQIKQQEKRETIVDSEQQQSLTKIVERLKIMKGKVENYSLSRKEMRKKIRKLENELDKKNDLLSKLFGVVRSLLFKLFDLAGSSKIFAPFMKKAIEGGDEINNTTALTAATKKLGDVSELKIIIDKLENELRETQDELEAARRSKRCTGKCSTGTNTGSRLNEMALKQKESELEDEIKKRQDEVKKLHCKCTELESTLSQAQERAANLQKAVDLYQNSVNVLEATEEKSKIEIEQQKITISNLQEALVGAKSELDEYRQKNQQEVQNQIRLTNVFYDNLMTIQNKRDFLVGELTRVVQSYKGLQDLNFELEVEHFNSLQDIAILETHVHRYQIDFKEVEDTKTASKNEVKKLKQQKRCYEQVVCYFKHEMAVMSEQLEHLQEILNISNQSCREENDQLSRAVLELQNMNTRLQSQLNENEHKVALESQMNKMKDAKIEELSRLVSRKDQDLTKHDRALQELKKNLENSILENHELQSAICHLQCVIQAYEIENQTSKSSRQNKPQCLAKSEGSSPRVRSNNNNGDEELRRKFDKLQGDYNHQKDLLNEATKELQTLKEKQDEKTKQLSRINDELRKKIASYEMKNVELGEECGKLEEEKTQLCQAQCKKDQECQQYKQIVGDLRQSMLELNGSLAESEINKTNLCQEFVKTHQQKIKEVQKEQDFSMKCRCEIALYKKLVENFKTTIIQLTKQLNEAATQNTNIRREMKIHENKVAEYQKRLAKKEREFCEFRHEMAAKLKKAEAEENRLAEFISYLKQEVQNKADQYACICKEATKDSSLASTQEEISSLKDEIKRMIENQVALNSENDKLLNEVARLQNLSKPLEEQNRALRTQLDQYLVELKSLREGNRSLSSQNEVMTGELHKAQCYCNQLEQKQKVMADSCRNLEMQLYETKNNRDDICAESRQVVTNVKMWLEEQRKINNDVKKKAKCYCSTIDKLKQENETLLSSCQCPPPSPTIPNKTSRYGRNNTSPAYGGCLQMDYQSPWSLGSQGTGSLGRDSPTSCLSGSVEEWYSPTYRDDDETDDHEEEFIRRVENMTTQLQCNNKCWKSKLPEYLVSKDDK